MWVFTKHGFVAIVQHNSLPDHFQVKSRVVDPLENLWPGHDIEVIDWADYRFRITMPKSDAMRVLEAQIADVDYTSFKTRCESDQDYHYALTRVWSIMYNYQSRMEGLNVR